MTTTTRKRKIPPLESVGGKVCGHCAGAPMSQERELSHLRCALDMCGCRAAGHQPDEAVRRAQASYCHCTTVYAASHDPGIHPALAKGAARFAEYGTSGKVAGVVAMRDAAKEFKTTSAAALKAALKKMDVPASQYAKLDTKALRLLAIEKRGFAAALHARRERNQKADALKSLRADSDARREQRMASKGSNTNSKSTTTTKKESKTMTQHAGIKVGTVLVATRDFSRPASHPKGALKVKEGDKVTVTAIEAAGQGATIVAKQRGNGEIVFAASNTAFAIEGQHKPAAPAKSAAAKAPAKKAPAKKAAAKKATKAPAKKAPAKTVAAHRKATSAKRTTRKAVKR